MRSKDPAATFHAEFSARLHSPRAPVPPTILAPMPDASRLSGTPVQNWLSRSHAARSCFGVPRFLFQSALRSGLLQPVLLGQSLRQAQGRLCPSCCRLSSRTYSRPQLPPAHAPARSTARLRTKPAAKHPSPLAPSQHPPVLPWIS